MTTPLIECKHCGYEGLYDIEVYGEICQDCGEGKRCPKCRFDKITYIGSSTLPIIRNKYIDGSLVNKKILALPQSIHWICSQCTYEW